MQNATSFLLTDAQAGISATDTFNLFRVRQSFPRPVERDIPGAVHRELSPFLSAVEVGQRIAISGSSRGISNLALVIKECASALRAVGAHPFVVPGMGSHGGATANGQIRVLAETNQITEASVGCPIHSSMDVVKLGETESGFPVFQDRLCCEADGVLVVNRVKPHTSFTHKVESGLCKMLVIGLGKQAGASKSHQQALRLGLGPIVLDATQMVIDAPRPRLVGALALVENAFKETAVVKGVPVHSYEALVDGEAALLRKAYELLPRLPFDDLDGLVIDEIGKNISGSGMDTNVTGKKPGLSQPRVGAIYVRGLTEETHGNAVGIGYADVIPRSLVSQVDLNTTYMNAFTAKHLEVGKLPMLAENELQAMQILLNFREGEEISSARLAWIKHTLALDEFKVSEALLDEVKANPNLEILGQPTPMSYDHRLNLR